MIQSERIIFDFNDKTDIRDWRVVDDVVMGGRSDGNIELTKNGAGLFYGTVSTENYGGFSSVRHRLSIEGVRNYKNLVIRIKGDGKKYQIRIKASRNDYHSYIQYFDTDESWQTISIPLENMYPQFRGRQLNMENFNVDRITEIAFLIGNKRNESFRLEIDKIYLN